MPNWATINPYALSTLSKTKANIYCGIFLLDRLHRFLFFCFFKKPLRFCFQFGSGHPR